MNDQRSPSRDSDSREWFKDWFNHPLYLKVYSHRDDAEAAQCVETILRITGLETAPERTSVLDIACGAGRHAFAFARKGLQVTANDLSQFLLGTAEEEARKTGLPISFSGCDMRSLRLERNFDLIVQLFSSFGYFETDAEDREVVRNVSQMLRSNGWYVLDLINPSWLRRHFIPRTDKTVGNLSISEERSLSEDKVVKKISISDTDGHQVAFTESVRLFSPEMIVDILECEGLEVVRIAGDYRGAEFSVDASPRMMLFSRKRR